MPRPALLSMILLTVAGFLSACDALKYFGPENSERDAMEEREELMEQAGANKRIAVYPIRRHDGVDAEGARELAALIEQRGLGSTRAREDGPWFELRRSMNEQSLLWEVARKFRDHVRENPPLEDYALYADYMLNEEEGRVFAVHFVVCDRAGEWVLVEFQNSHHEDFQRVAPRSRAGCARLVVEQLAD